jgi:manganese-dependent inorganic pyrophosphatase
MWKRRLSNGKSGRAEGMKMKGTDNMNKKVSSIIIAVLLILAAAVGGYFAGKSTETAKYKEEQELTIALNKSELDALGKIDGPIYVTGHKSPDADTVGSSIAYAELLTKLGYDAHAVVLEKINKETKFILEASGVEVPELLEDASGCNMVLVDHSDYEQSADGLQDAHIISIIDHHGDGSVRTGNQLIYDARPLGATATIIWMRYRSYGLEPDKETAHVMIGSIFSDTHNLEYDSTTFADKEAVKALAKLAGLTDLDSFWQDMHAAALSYEGMTDEEIFFDDYKEYECAGKNYGIGCMKAADEEGARDLAERMTQVMPAAVRSTGMDFVISQISINEGDVSIAYFVPANDMAKDVLEAAFGDTTVFDGTSFIMTPSVSRKSVVVPAITDVLNSYPKE